MSLPVESHGTSDVASWSRAMMRSPPGVAHVGAAGADAAGADRSWARAPLPSVPTAIATDATMVATGRERERSR